MRTSRIAAAAGTLLLGIPLTALGQGSQLGMFVRAQANRYEGKEFYVERLKGLELVGDWEDAGDGRVRCRGNCIVYKVEDVYVQDGTAVGKQARVLSATEVAVLAGTTPGSDVMRLYGEAMMDVQVDVNKAVTGAPDPTGGILRTEMYRAGVDVETDDSCYPSDFDGPLPEGASRCPPDRGLVSTPGWIPSP